MTYLNELLLTLNEQTGAFAPVGLPHGEWETAAARLPCR